MRLPVRKGLNKDMQVHKHHKHNHTDMQHSWSIETCNLFLHWVKVMNREEASHVPVLFLRQQSRLMHFPVQKGLNREVWRSQRQTFPQILPRMVLPAKRHTDIFRQLKKRNPKTVQVKSLGTTS